MATVRKVICIDEDKCTGCGECIPNCPEGALQIIDGKARLVSDLFCDGLGACVGTCPEDAMRIEEQVSNGEGLLSKNGVSIGNLLSGDAPRWAVTVSAYNRQRRVRHSLGTRDLEEARRLRDVELGLVGRERRAS